MCGWVSHHSGKVGHDAAVTWPGQWGRAHLGTDRGRNGRWDICLPSSSRATPTKRTPKSPQAWWPPGFLQASEKPRTVINWEMWVPAEAGSCRVTPVWSWWLQNGWRKRWPDGIWDGAQEESRTSLTTDVNYLTGFLEQSKCLINESYFYYQTQFLWITYTLRSHYIKWYQS